MTVAAAPPPANHTQSAEQTEAPALFNRPPRILRTLPTDEVEIPGPPQAPSQRVGGRLVSILIPLASSVVYLGIAVARSGSNGGSLLNTLPIVAIALLTGGAAYYTFRQQQQAHKLAVLAYKASYQEALERTRRRLQQLERQQRSYYEENNPDLKAMLQIASGEQNRDGQAVAAARLWERRPADADFLCLRVGRGDRPTSLTLKPPSVSTYSKDVEDSLLLAEQFRFVRDVPLEVNLRAVGSLGIAGPSGRSLNVLQALLWQLAIHHAPSEVRIAAFWDSTFDDSWDSLRYLPHTRPLDGDESYRLLARYDRNPEDMRRVLAALAKELKRRAEDGQNGRYPHLIVVLSDHHLHHEESAIFAQCITGRHLNVSAICLVPEVRDVPGECGGYIDLVLGGSPEHARLGVAGPGGGYVTFKADVATTAQSSEIALQLASVELADADGGREMPRNVQLLTLLGVPDAATYDPSLLWAKMPASSWHPVPVGCQSADVPLEIDLNEGVHGVHGMIAGATGAGKSELLLSFLMSLAIRHHPDRLNFLLIDFKGGATFRDIDQLPHTAGMVTDLSGFLAERALIAMNSELDRRKRLLAKAGLPNIRSYRKAGVDQRGAPLAPLPNLFIAIDEFDEMIRDYPQFQDELIRVGKQGRSLGVHLLLATQQPSLIKEGLLNNLSYWMSLRVNSREDSKAMVGMPDAALLGTDTPGRGFFRDKNSGVRMFQSALITAPYRPVTGRKSIEVDITGHVRVNTSETRTRQVLQTILDQLVEELKTTISEVMRAQIIEEKVKTICAQFNQIFDQTPDAATLAEQRRVAGEEIQHLLHGLRQLQFDASQISEAEAIEQQIVVAAHQTTDRLRGDREQRSEIELVASRMIAAQGARYAAKHYRIWAEPLPAILPLVALPTHAPPPAAAPDARVREPWLDIAYGLVDCPEEARYDQLTTDLAGAGGNLLALGASGSGKTTLLHTVILALANAHSPADLWFYIIDSTGGGLGLRDKLPHLAQAIAPRQHLLIERLLAEIQDQLEGRRELFQHQGVASLVLYRERHTRQPKQIPPPPPAIVVVIDNLAELTSQNDQIGELLRSLMRECRAYGIYFIVTAYTIRDVGQLIANFETRIALRLNSEGDSAELIGKDYASKLIKPDQAGRAFLRGTPRPREAQIALPSLQARAKSVIVDPSAEAAAVAYSDVAGEIELSLTQVRTKWQTVMASNPTGAPQALRLLPTTAELEPLLRTLPAVPAAALPLGIDGATLQPLPWVLDQTAHLLITGALRSGKSSLLRTLLAAFAQRFTPDQAEVILIDYSLRALRTFEQLPHARRFTGLTIGKETRDIALVTEKDELTAVIQQLNGELSERLALLRRGLPMKRRTIIVIHNWDLVAQDNPNTTALDSYIRRGSDIGVHCIVSYTSTESSVSSGPSLMKAIRTSCAELVVGRPPEGASYAAPITRRFKSVLASDMPVGRGFVLETGQAPRMVQFAYADTDQLAAMLASMTPIV